MKFVIQKEAHSSIINQVHRETLSWGVGDGMITQDDELGLIAYAADCCLVSFWNETKIGICHAGWRGYSQGIIAQMAAEFPNGNCHIAPFYHKFEIQKDDCHDAIARYCGEEFFSVDKGKIFFDFRTAVIQELKKLPYTIDDRETFTNPILASWRRDQQKGNGTQNRLVIWKNKDGSIENKLFLPSEEIRAYFKVPNAF